MVQAAQLSYTDTTGYYGLRVSPSYGEMLRSLEKKVFIPQPDRSAKWYATGIYRAFLLEQAKRFNDAQRKDLEYDDSGAALPRSAARGQQSMAGTDDTWDRQEQFNSNLDLEEAKRIATDALASERRGQANQVRKQQLSAGYGLVAGHWTVDAHHEDLQKGSIPHAAPLPKLARPPGQWRAPPNEFAAQGQPQAQEFPTFEQLNLGQDARYKLGRPAPLGINKDYEQLRQNYLR